MTERLELGISRIWAESWTSLEALAGRHDLFGDLIVRVGATDLPGIHVEREGEAHLNQCVYELMGLRYIKKAKASFTATFHAASPVKYTIARDGERLFFTASSAESGALPGFDKLELDFAQVKQELTRFKAKMRELLRASCPTEGAGDWWWQNARERLDEE